MTGKERKTKVYHADLWSLRERKYAWLSEHDWKTTNWQEVRPRSEFYLFVPRDEAALDKYSVFVPITTIFPVHGVGIITRKDKLTIRWTKHQLWTTVLNFSRMDSEQARHAYGIGRDTNNWKVKSAQEDLRHTGPDRKHIVPILYRPFDIRYTYYTGKSTGFHSRPCREVMQHMMRKNLALIASRQVLREFRHVFVTDQVANFNNIDTAGRFGSGYVFPLYLYLDGSTEDLFSDRKPDRKNIPNLDPQVIEVLRTSCGQELMPEDLFHYIYAILHAESYRMMYTEFLQIDFPRIPFTEDYGLFQKLAALGEQLVDLHLLRSPELDPPIARFQAKGDNKVRSGKKGLRYELEAQWVYINEEQHFEDVPLEVWKYMIGGYQVCHKWLKDRKDRTLSLEELRTYCRIVTALSKTIAIQAEIDTLYPQVEKTLLPIHL